jgi:acyl phosphate:glycerol-3-phosphate acyltransferase
VNPALLILYFAVAYLLGAIPSAYLAGKILSGIDIRQHGSKNVGATNAYRVLGAKIGIGVLLADILKGVGGVLAGYWMGLPEWAPVLGGILAIAGHNWTVFLNFKGGKGVATSAGVFLALTPFAFLTSLLFFVSLVAATRYISVGSMGAAVILATVVTIEYFLQILDRPILLTWLIALAASVFVIIRHRANIERLLKKEEKRFSFKSHPGSQRT